MPIQDILPFNCYIVPSGPEAIDPDAMSVGKGKLQKLIDYGVPANRAVDLFVDWADRLPLPMTSKGGHRCRMIPLGCNYGFDRAHILSLMGQPLYDNYFDSRVRDVQTFANGINECYAMCGVKVRYSKVNLAWLAKKHDIDTAGAHDSLVDCKITAAVYKAMVEEFSQNIPIIE